MSGPYREPGPLARLAPRTSLRRLAWAWCRGVFGRLEKARERREDGARYPGLPRHLRPFFARTLKSMDGIVATFDGIQDRIGERRPPKDLDA